MQTPDGTIQDQSQLASHLVMVALVNQVESMNDEKVNQLIEKSL